MQSGIFAAGSTEDFMIVTSATGEPIISTMELDTADPITPRSRNSGITAYQPWQLQKLRRDLRKEYLGHLEATVSEMVRDDLSMLSSVRLHHTQLKQNAESWTSCETICSYYSYTGVWNASTIQALVFPVTTVDPTLDARMPSGEFYNDVDRDVHEMYDPETFKNAPVCLQLVDRTPEEAVIKIAKIVDDALAVSKLARGCSIL